MALAPALVLAACTAAAPPERQARGLVPDAGGLQPNGTSLRIDFGRARSGVIPAVSRLLGGGPVARRAVPGCGEVVSWPDGLSLTFVGPSFAGWRIAGSDGATAGSAGKVC